MVHVDQAPGLISTRVIITWNIPAAIYHSSSHDPNIASIFNPDHAIQYRSTFDVEGLVIGEIQDANIIDLPGSVVKHSRIVRIRFFSLRQCS